MRGPDLSAIDWDNAPPNDSIMTRAIVSMAVSFALVVFTLALRLYCRFVVVKKPGWDDWTIILATMCSLIQLIFNALFIHYGQGRHVFYLNSNQINQSYRYSNLVIIPFIICTAITKISIAFMVLRLTQAKWMKVYMAALIVSLVLVNGACLVILFAFCRPTHALWDITVKEEKCWDGSVLGIASSFQGVWSILTDLICTSTPLIMIWKLRMGLNQKVAITILIGLGLATTGCSIGRCLYYYKTNFIHDQTWVGIDLVIWTTLEVNVGIFASNLPALGFLRKKLEDKLASLSCLSFLFPKSEQRPDLGEVPTFGGGVRRKHGPVDSVLQSDDRLMSLDESPLDGDANLSLP